MNKIVVDLSDYRGRAKHGKQPRMALAVLRSGSEEKGVSF
jgi:hypothetical protein